MGRPGAKSVIVLLLLIVACGPGDGREYELRGQIVAVDPARQLVTIKHEDIPRFMPGMTMAFRVANKSLLDGRTAGDLVKATLVVRDGDVHLRTLERTGFSPVAETAVSPLAPLAPGDTVADAAFVDQSGTARRLSDWRGQVLALTFIYTRCPVPTFCPVMDRHFRAVQDGILSDPRMKDRARMLSVSFDPAHDTPAVLSQHAAKVRAEPGIWSFLTGRADQIDAFARQFGVSIVRESETSEEIVHNLRTAVIDANGRLATILNGSEWTPADLLSEIRKVVGTGS